MATWKEMLREAFAGRKEDFESMICTLTEEDQNVEFDSDYGGLAGKPFTAWGEKYVYSPLSMLALSG